MNFCNLFLASTFLGLILSQHVQPVKSQKDPTPPEPIQTRLDHSEPIQNHLDHSESIQNHLDHPEPIQIDLDHSEPIQTRLDHPESIQTRLEPIQIDLDHSEPIQNCRSGILVQSGMTCEIVARICGVRYFYLLIYTLDAA
jgi:hypothetical protein